MKMERGRESEVYKQKDRIKETKGERAKQTDRKKE